MLLQDFFAFVLNRIPDPLPWIIRVNTHFHVVKLRNLEWVKLCRMERLKEMREFPSAEFGMRNDKEMRG